MPPKNTRWRAAGSPRKAASRPCRPATLYSLALVRAHRGQVQQARELASQALALCEQTGNVPVASRCFPSSGSSRCRWMTHQSRACPTWTASPTTATAFGLGEPGVVKFLPDEIEALAALGEVDLARSFTRQLEARGQVARPSVGAGDGCPLPRPSRRRSTATSRVPGPPASRRCQA